MGRSELIASLQLQGEKKSREIWHKAETEAQTLKKAGNEAIEQRRAEADALQSRLVAEQSRPVLLAGERQARAIRAAARQKLALTLYELAQENLVQLRKTDYDGLFAALSQELPPLQWQQVSVTPTDQERAERHFPGAEISLDPNIVGGMKVVDASGRIRVNNTLQKRLERAWPDLLPDLLATTLKKEGLE